MKLSNNTKGYLVILGGILMHLVSGVGHIWSYLNVYLISYLREFNPSLRLIHGFFLSPLAIFSISLTMSLGGYLERNYGPRQVTSLGLSLIILSHVILYFSKSLYIDYASMLILGCGVGCNYLVPVRLGYKYFPKRRGLIVGISQIGLAISATFLNLFAEWIINPDNIEPKIVIDGEKYYTYEESLGIKLYLLVFIIGGTAISIIVIILFSPFVPEETNKDIAKEKLIPNDSHISDIPEDEQKEEKKVETQKDGIIVINSVKEGVKTKYFWLLFSMGFFSNIFPPLVSNTFRVYGQNNQISIVLLKYLASGLSGLNSFSRLLWGLLFDKIGFKKIILLSNFCIGIIAFSFYYSVNILWLYSLFTLLTGLFMGSYYTIFAAHISKLFGIKFSSEIYGLIFISFGISNLFGPLFIFIFQKMLKVTTFLHFKIGYFIGGSFSIISFIIAIFYKIPKIK